MSLELWFAALPLWLSTVVVVVLPTLLAMGCSMIVRRAVTLERLTTNNEVAGFKFAVLGVVYAVLLGFAVIVVWEKFHDAQSAVAEEAGITAALFRLSNGLDGPSGAALRAGLQTYLHDVIEGDWPAMAGGHASPAATRALSGLYEAVLTDHPADARGAAALSAVFSELDQLGQARRTRIALAGGVVPSVLWIVLFLGAVVTVGFTFFFGTLNLEAQVLMTGLLAMSVFMGLLVILSVNRPFTGDISVNAKPLEAVLRDFAGHG